MIEESKLLTRRCPGHRKKLNFLTLKVAISQQNLNQLQTVSACLSGGPDGVKKLNFLTLKVAISQQNLNQLQTVSACLSGGPDGVDSR